jgi:radical SAM family protein/B12 binding protein
VRRKVRVLLLQLYGAKQPVNAEPLSAGSLAAFIKHELPESEVDIGLVGGSWPMAERRLMVQRIGDGGYDVVGLSVPQTTLALARELLAEMRRKSGDRYPLVVLGHALPMYAAQDFFEVDPGCVIVQGWGEVALVAVLRWHMNGHPALHEIAGVMTARSSGAAVSTAGRSASGHGLDIVPLRVAGDFFRRIESSRGCHYGKCTFCTRPPGDPRAWQRLPLARVEADVRALKALGVSVFTFTDEDFFGDDMDGALAVNRIVSETGNMTYSVSVRADNIWPVGGGAGALATRKSEFAELREGGLRKVFMGLESLSDSQLKRYGKGVNAETSAMAAKLLLDCDIDVELGFIPFDPLATLAELAENVNGLRRTGLWSAVGNIFVELRMQMGSPLMRSKRVENLVTSFDKEMMSWEWEFADSDVAEVHRLCMSWWSKVNGSYWAIRNIERTSLSSAARIAEISIRRASVDVLEAAVHSVAAGKTDEFADCIVKANRGCAEAALAVVRSMSAAAVYPQPLLEELVRSIDGDLPFGDAGGMMV